MTRPAPDAIRAETITINGHGGDGIEAYRAGPLADGSRGGIVEDPPEGMPKAMKPILELAPALSAPMLGLFGAEDRFPTPDAVATLDAELTRLGKAHDFYSYDGAGHSFFSVDRPAYRVEAAVDDWRRIGQFFDTHLKG
jgi:carboxymethylenebutenolidase